MKDTIVLKAIGKDRIIFFEPTEDSPKNEFYHAKKFQNSVYVKTGNFENYSFEKNIVTEALPSEKDRYLMLRNASKFMIGKIVK
jgi:hypothetical protein